VRDLERALGQIYDFQSTIFQPVGGMDMSARALAREIGSLIRYNAKVTAIKQNDSQATVTYVDARTGGAPMTATADWCLCTIRLSVLDQIDLDVSAKMKEAINAVPYGAAAKIGLQFKRRFWEEDEQIYGGITYTDLPIWQISYPSTSYGRPRQGRVARRLRVRQPLRLRVHCIAAGGPRGKAIEYGAQIHPQYQAEYDNGIAVGWHRVPWVLGCFGRWTDEARKQHYENLCAIDGRIVLAGEHVSHIPAWQEGAVLSSLDAISRLHRRVLAS
jgi:monoamine oxidase